MKLTNQQISIIAETLNLNGVVYDDIKLELLDHIASEIEFLMEENTLSFEENLKIVFEKWEPQLKPASDNLWVGYGLSVPKIILDKLVIEKKKELFVMSSIVIVLTLSLIVLNIFFKNPFFITIIVQFLKSVSLIGAFFLLITKLLLLKSKMKTTYLFLFKRNFYLVLFYGLLIGIGLIPIFPSNKNIEIKVLSLIMTLVYLILIYSSLNNFYKHYQIEKKLSLSNS